MTTLWNIQLKKSYPHELRPFHLDVQFQSDAKRLVLFGPSGAGKTQILKMIAGLIQPDVGLIQFNGNPLLDTQRNINQKPQERSCLLYTSDAADD